LAAKYADSQKFSAVAGMSSVIDFILPIGLTYKPVTGEYPPHSKNCLHNPASRPRGRLRGQKRSTQWPPPRQGGQPYLLIITMFYWQVMAFIGQVMRSLDLTGEV
jgi:hypothetical protein